MKKSQFNELLMAIYFVGGCLTHGVASILLVAISLICFFLCILHARAGE